jgi:hypothetical protein
MPAYAKPPEVVMSLKDREPSPHREPNIIRNESSDDETYNFSGMQRSISNIHPSAIHAHNKKMSYLYQVEEEKREDRGKASQKTQEKFFIKPYPPKT